MSKSENIMLFEEFNAAEAKKELADKNEKLKLRNTANKERLAKAAKTKDETRQAIIKAKIEIDKLDMQKLQLKNTIIDLKVKKQKEKASKAAKAAKQK